MTGTTGAHRILIVEDSEDLQMLLRQLFESEGYDVSYASHGEEALKVLAGANPLPDLILLDLMMPVMDGYQFRAEQALDPRIANVPVVIMSADGNLQAKTAKVRPFATIRKPMDIALLLETVERCLKKKPPTDVNQPAAEL